MPPWEHHGLGATYRRYMRTCREEILTAVKAIVAADGTFSLAGVVAAMSARKSRYGERTVRTHVSSLMRADSPDHHACTYDDFVRVGRGVYRLRDR